MSNQIGHPPVRLEAATTESREVRVSDTSHLARPMEVQKIIELAKPAANRAVPRRESEVSQQENGGGADSTQIGHVHVRLDAQGQAAVQCRQNEILQQQKSSGAVSTQSGYVSVRLEAQGRTADPRRQSDSLQQRNSRRAV